MKGGGGDYHVAALSAVPGGASVSSVALRVSNSRSKLPPFVSISWVSPFFLRRSTSLLLPLSLSLCVNYLPRELVKLYSPSLSVYTSDFPRELIEGKLYSLSFSLFSLPYLSLSFCGCGWSAVGAAATKRVCRRRGDKRPAGRGSRPVGPVDQNDGGEQST